MKRKRLLEKIELSQDKSTMLKMYFPTFFFTGLYCFFILVLSAFQYTNNENVNCYKAIDCFLVDMSIGVILFQFFSLKLIPKKVGKINYFKILFVVLIINSALYCLVWLLADNFVSFHMSWLLTDSHKNVIQLFAIVIGMIPLLYLLVVVVYHITAYIIITSFYNLLISQFKNRIEARVEEDIQSITS